MKELLTTDGKVLVPMLGGPVDFRDLVGRGYKVRYAAGAGVGRHGREYVAKVGKVNPLLIFATHCVVNAGGKYGIPAVVDHNNLLAVLPPKGNLG